MEAVSAATTSATAGALCGWSELDDKVISSTPADSLDSFVGFMGEI